jgi:thiamine biosynthesis lipoprotein
VTAARCGAQSTGGDVAEIRFSVWGSAALVLVSEPGAVRETEALLRTELDEMDRACSRFRADSEIRELSERAGSAVVVSPLLGDVLDVALRAAYLTDGLVDPTVGAAMAAIGYDRDFAGLPADGPSVTATAAPGWWRIGWDRSARTVLLPLGIALDVGATAKALAADRAVTRIAEKWGCGALVSLGGDIAVAGEAPPGGWRIAVGEDHTRLDPTGGQNIAIVSGGLATSGTTRRRWRRGGVAVHHIVDPRTGVPAESRWRTVSVAAGSCIDANTASTASVVLGSAAPRWLAQRGLPARLVATDGQVTTVAGWPTDAAIDEAQGASV